MPTQSSTLRVEKPSILLLQVFMVQNDMQLLKRVHAVSAIASTDDCCFENSNLLFRTFYH
jgi:hypothetical protein